jgi:hypothetical protein
MFNFGMVTRFKKRHRRNVFLQMAHQLYILKKEVVSKTWHTDMALRAFYSYNI